MGVNIIWNQSELKLIIDDTMKSFFEEYDTKNETLDQFINFVGEEDKQNVLSFFSQDLKRHYINREQMQLQYKMESPRGNIVEFILVGKSIKSNEQYYFTGTSYCFKDLENEYGDIDSLTKNWKESMVNKTIDSIIHSDRITGLPNKYFFKNTVAKMLQNVVNSNTRAAMLIIDLDNFKYVNDSYGHDFGDLVLKEVGYNIVESVTEDILVSRYSGNTFLLFKPNIIEYTRNYNFG